MEITCIKCGECCKRLYWSDRIKISWYTRTIMLSKICSFLTDTPLLGNLCTIHRAKPNVCKNWYCGAMSHNCEGVEKMALIRSKPLVPSWEEIKWEEEKANRMSLILLLKAMHKDKEGTYHPPKFSVRLLYGVSHKSDEPSCLL